MCIRLIASKKGVNKRVFNGAKMLKQKKKMLQIVYITAFCTTFVRCFSISRQKILRVSANKA